MDMPPEVPPAMEVRAMPTGSADPHQWLPGCGQSAWLFSLVLHGAAMTTLGLTINSAPQGAAETPVREGGIVLVARTDGKAEYFSDENSRKCPVSAAATAASYPSAVPPMALAGPQLPTAQQLLAAEVAVGNAASAVGMQAATGIGHGGPPGRGYDNAVETQVFGVKGRGCRFVYVFDRSSSMEGGPLVAAKRELIASLHSLQSVHQFQIIFYNQEPHVMSPFRERSAAMVFGDEPGKRLAANFVGGIYADGATDHLKALQRALQMRPDVIFFLTDADEPELRTDDFQRIRRLNNGTCINTIEFGRGPPQARFSFLQKLATENGGQHAYVDVTRLAR
jgi:hypothetical protein